MHITERPINQYLKIICSPRNLFFILSAIILTFMLTVATQVGTGGDEVMDGTNGKFSLEYFCNGDTTFVDYSKDPIVRHVHMKYYGVGFEIIPAAIVKFFHADRYEYLIRHLLNGLFGFIFMFFAGLAAKELKNWHLASLTLLFMALTPSVFGLCFNDSKDIPMATGFAIAVYAYLRIYKHLPGFRWQEVLLAIVGIAIAVSIRIGGLMLVFYFGIGLLLTFICKKELRELIKKKRFRLLLRIVAVSFGIVFIGTLAGLCAYPNFFYEGPVSHVKNAITLVSKFQYNIPFLFEGEIVQSTKVPDWYLLKMYLITIPVFCWLGILAFFLLIPRVFKRYDKEYILLFVFMTVFPPLYISWTDASVYNGWRHTLFIYSSFATISATGIYELCHVLKKKNFRILYAVGTGIMILPTAWWMCSNYKYTYAYYNALVPSPYLKYDIEYYETSSTLGYDWLRENVLTKSDKHFLIASKIFTPRNYGMALGDTNVTVIQSSFMGFAETDCDYFILTPQIISPKVLKSFFPPKGTIHTEYVDHIPVCAVVEKKDKFDCHGIKAIQEGKINEGMVLLEKAYAADADNFGIWFWMGYGYFYQQKYKEAISFFNKYVTFLPSGRRLTLSYILSGQAFIELKLYDEALKTLQTAERLCETEDDKLFVHLNSGIAYFNKKEYPKAIPYLKETRAKYPSAKTLLYNCYLNTGDKENAARLQSE